MGSDILKGFLLTKTWRKATMPKGIIVNTPSDYSAYARVRDEYGQEYTVHGSEIATDAEDGDQFAYHVDIWQNSNGSATTLRSGGYDEDS